MALQKDEVSEMGESEDIPSDFFDDFNKDEFMEGLSVVDECWDDAKESLKRKKSRLLTIEKDVEGVKDLRELIDDDTKRKAKLKTKRGTFNKSKPSPKDSALDSYIKPGSRRDPSKTNEAIKKDKEVKVQQFLAKTLESQDDIRPPGTELDDYFDHSVTGNKPALTEEVVADQETSKQVKQSSPAPQQPRPRPRYSPRRRSPRAQHSPHARNSPRRSPRRNRQMSPVSNLGLSSRNFRRNNNPLRRSPQRGSSRRRSPGRRSPIRRSPVRRSPVRRSPNRRSPVRRNPVRRSPVRRSPVRRSPHQRRHSRSPRRRSRSRSPLQSDSFLYPNQHDGLPSHVHGYVPYQQGTMMYAPMQTDYPQSMPGFYTQAPGYGTGFPDTYGYGVPMGVVPQVPQSVLDPAIMPSVNPNLGPPMVPAPMESVPALALDKTTPYDALAQLVAEGKISQEDYLKLTPYKGATASIDPKTKIMVMSRCQQAISTLKEKLLLPNHLIIDNQIVGVEYKCIAPKYCSPLKRLSATELNFTKGSVTAAEQTKQLVESIISTLGLDKVISKYTNKLPKDRKDAVVQTTKPQCEVCEIREATKYRDASTSIDPEYLTSTVHTQVVEEDLISSKSIFNPSGSVGEGAAISIAHLTPAQLVSQLAARAKTLKQPQESSPSMLYPRRPPANYDYDNRGGQYHHSYNNYRY